MTKARKAANDNKPLDYLWRYYGRRAEVLRDRLGRETGIY